MRQPMPVFAPYSPWPYLEAYPPIKVRLLSRSENGRRALTNAEIAIAGEFTIERVAEMSVMGDWETVTVAELKRFCAACRFDPLSTADRVRIADYENKCLKRNSKPFQWLHRSPAYQTEFLPLIRRLQQLAHSPTSHAA